jgi:hypothetical protein
MVISTHWEGCWDSHMDCAQLRIDALEKEIAKVVALTLTCSACGSVMTEESSKAHFEWHQRVAKDLLGGPFGKAEGLITFTRYEEAKACVAAVEEMIDWANETGAWANDQIVVPANVWATVLQRVIERLWERADSHPVY